MKQAFYYSLKVWLTTTILSSVVSMVMQSIFLDPGYHAYFPSHVILDWLSQLGMVNVVEVVILIPFFLICLLLSYMFLKQSLRTKTLIYVIAPLFGTLPDLLFILYELRSQSLKHELKSIGGQGFLFNALACGLIGLACLWFYKLEPVKGLEEVPFNE